MRSTMKRPQPPDVAEPRELLAHLESLAGIADLHPQEIVVHQQLKLHRVAPGRAVAVARNVRHELGRAEGGVGDGGLVERAGEAPQRRADGGGRPGVALQAEGSRGAHLSSLLSRPVAPAIGTFRVPPGRPYYSPPVRK